MSRIDDLIQYAFDQGLFNQDPPVGCSDDEIEELRRDQRVSRLPGSYVTYLQKMGRSTGLVLRGSDVFYPRLLGMKARGQELLLENDTEERLENESFVIGMHQGYQLFWFPSVLDEEPPVIMYQEGDRRRSLEWPDFTHYLDDFISAVDRR